MIFIKDQNFTKLGLKKQQYNLLQQACNRKALKLMTVIINSSLKNSFTLVPENIVNTLNRQGIN